MRRVYAMPPVADVLPPARVGRDDPPPDPPVLGSTVLLIAGLRYPRVVIMNPAQDG